MAETRTLCHVGDVVLGVSWCGPLDPGPSPEELEPGFTVIFPQSGSYVRHVGGVETLATPAVALFTETGVVSRTSHPLGGHDRSLYLTVPDDLMAWFSGAPPRAPLRADVAHAVRSAAIHASQGEVVPPLHLEELALLARSATMVTVEVNGSRRNVVRRAEEYLACHYGEDADLGTVAAHVGYSPHHLSRVFRHVTGMSLSVYRTRLRVSGAIDRLLAGESDIARVAVDCGFYDHAHLIRQLRRHAGPTPSEIRRLGGFPGLPAPNKAVE